MTALELDDSPALRRAVARHTVVLNCAGPFARTWRPLVEACLATGTHYLDLCGEWSVFAELAALDGVARERGVMLLPGVAFDVVASDCLAAHVARRLPGARRLELGISGLDLVSRGSLRTMLGAVGEPVRVRRGGALVACPGIREASFDFGNGPRAAYGASWGDVVTAFHTTGIPEIEVYFEATPLTMAVALADRSFGWMKTNPAWRRLTELAVERLPAGPPAHRRLGHRATLVARAVGAAGRAEARLVTPEAYSFSASSAVSVARRVLAGDARPGFQTPAGLLGPDFVLSLAGVVRHDIAS